MTEASASVYLFRATALTIYKEDGTRSVFIQLYASDCHQQFFTAD